MQYEHIKVPADGLKITVNPDGSINVPDRPIVPFIEGDGIGIDVTPVMLKVVNAAVQKAYGGRRKISWMEIYSGDKGVRLYGTSFPDETLHALREFVVSIKGPLGTPIGGGMRSLNVAMRHPGSVATPAAREVRSLVVADGGIAGPAGARPAPRRGCR